MCYSIKDQKKGPGREDAGAAVFGGAFRRGGPRRGGHGMKQNYKMWIEYDGTRYHGWQSQKNTDATIQGKLNGVFSKLEGEAVEVQGSGRTDAGAHAAGQVANVRLSVEMEDREIQEYANRYLPEDIGILRLEKAPERFHARLSAVRKTYCYRIFNSGGPNVFGRRWMHAIPQKLDVRAMREGAGYLEGTHDFAGFCRNSSKKKTTVRTIFRIEVERDGDEVDVTVTGDGFLPQMVRILAGTLAEVGLGKMRPQEIARILESGAKGEAGPALPAKGLILQSVEYGAV